MKLILDRLLELLAQATPKLLDHFAKVDVAANEIKLDQEIQVDNHQTISKVTIKKKTETLVDETEKGQKVQQGLEQLAQQMLEQHEYVEPQKPAISIAEFELDEYAVDDNRVEEDIDQSASIQPQANDEPVAVKKKVTKKKS